MITGIVGVTVERCECCSFVATLLRVGIWPSTPGRPTFAFDLQFLFRLQAMVLEGQVSVKAFAESFKQQGIITNEEVNAVTRTLELSDYS